MQEDPIGDGVNWYAYAGNNPVRWVDPEGLWELAVDAYAGIGATFAVGYDPATGWFARTGAGFGIGLAGRLDPCAYSPARYAGRSHGSSYGLAESASVGWLVGALSVWDYGSGSAYDDRGNWYRYRRGPSRPHFVPSVSPVRRLGLAFSVGAEAAMY